MSSPKVKDHAYGKMADGNKYKKLIKGIGNVGELSTEEFVEISRGLFSLVTLCNCKDDGSLDGVMHQCKKLPFKHHDYIHSSKCRCCQMRILLYYLGRCLEDLAYDGRLDQFNEDGLSHARDHIEIGSELIFRITRHPGAWDFSAKMREEIHTYVFDFKDLTLKELPYDALMIGTSVRVLMNSRSDWKGTSNALYTKLKRIAKGLNIDIESRSWPESPYKLSVALVELKEYLEKFGITIMKKRYARIVQSRKIPGTWNLDGVVCFELDRDVSESLPPVGNTHSFLSLRHMYKVTSDAIWCLSDLYNEGYAQDRWRIRQGANLLKTMDSTISSSYCDIHPQKTSFYDCAYLDFMLHTAAFSVVAVLIATIISAFNSSAAHFIVNLLVL